METQGGRIRLCGTPAKRKYIEEDIKRNTDDSGLQISFNDDSVETIVDDNGNYEPDQSLNASDIEFTARDASDNETETESHDTSTVSEELSDVCLFQWYINGLHINDQPVDEEKEKQNIATVLSGSHLVGGLRWDQVALSYHVNQIVLPFKADPEVAHQYIEKFDFVGHVLDSNGNKRYYLKTEAGPEDVRLEVDDQKSYYSSCNSSWGAETTANFELLLNDKWVDNNDFDENEFGELVNATNDDGEVNVEFDNDEVDVELNDSFFEKK